MPPNPIAPHPGPATAPDPFSSGSHHGSASPVPQSPLRPTSQAIRPSPIRTNNGTLITTKPIGPREPGTIADVVAASLGSKRERKRKRIHYSCAECHRRKHKCDRQTPCQPCIDRGLGDSCRPFEDGDQFGDMRDRVQRLEDIVEGLAMAQAKLAKELSDARKNGFEYIEMDSSGDEMPDADPNAPPGQAKPKPRKKRSIIRPDTARGMEREELYNSEMHAIAAVKGETIDSSSNQKTSGVRYDEGDNPLEGGLARDGDSWFGALALPSVSRGVIETEINGERLELGANFPRFPASVKLHRLIHEGGAPENILQELMACLPNKADTDRLLDIYFRDVNHTRLPIHEGTFRQSCEELMEFRWGNAKEERGDDGARHVPFLAFLFAILATAMRSLPESMGNEAEAKKGAMRLYHACRRTINIASTIRVDHIDLVLAHLFAARFLICQRQSAESWSLLGNAIRAAQAIGLHRDGSKLGLDAITTERRRRLWALIFYMDKTTSILLGRPQAIQEFHCDTLPPSDIDIDTMPRAARPYVPRTRPRPHTPPGVFLFVAIRHELARLTGKIVEHFQNLASPRRYADVVALDEELEKFRRDIPDTYRMDRSENGDCVGTDKSFDDVCPWLPLHRYLLNIEYHYVRIALHRPYVLRNSEKYSHSRAAAFESAKTDRMVRYTYRKDVKWEPDRARKVHMGGLYRLFNATMMIGIALLLDPTGPDAPEFMDYLEEFIELHRHREGETDQCSKREVKIIELFRTKARDPTWCATSATGAKRNGAAAGDKNSAAAVSSATLTTEKKTSTSSGEATKSGAAVEGQGMQQWTVNNGTSGASRQNGNGAAGNGVNGPFNLAQLFGAAQSPAGVGSSSTHAGDSVTPPPFAGLFGNAMGGMGVGSMGMGLSGVNMASGSSNDTPGDLAQSIFDQLGGYEPSFGMLNPTPNDGLTLGSAAFNGADLSSFDLNSLWTQTSGTSVPGAIAIPATSTNDDGPTTSAAFRPTAHPHLRALNIDPPSSGTPGAPSQPSGDWGLLPWGGLIEAIAQSSHVIETPKETKSESK